MTFTDIIKVQLTNSAGRLLESIDDVSDQEAVARPEGLVPIAWHVGHLTLYDRVLLNRAGLGVPIPDGYEDRFRKGSRGEGPFPSLVELRATFLESQHLLLELSGQTDLHSQPVTDSRGYANIAEGLAWMHYHRGYHVGKIMTLRSLLGKPLIG